MVLWIDTDRLCQKISRELNSGTCFVIKLCFIFDQKGFLNTCGAEPLRTMDPKGKSIRIDPNNFFSVRCSPKTFINAKNRENLENLGCPASCLNLLMVKYVNQQPSITFGSFSVLAKHFWSQMVFGHNLTLPGPFELSITEICIEFRPASF